MTQATTWSVPLVGPATPTLMAQRTDDSLGALLTGHSGSSRPAYAVAGTIWQDTSVAGTVKFYLYDGSDDNLLWTVDTSTGAVTFGGVTPSANQTYGQCQLTLSGGNLLLSRKNGRLLTINGAHYAIPSSGPTLAATGLTPSTLYYIYAYINSGTMTLEASTTAYATDATTGIQIKSGDATRTLVGMARPVTGPAWSDTVKQRFVRSWYNEPSVKLFSNFTVSRSTASLSRIELNTEIRSEFLVWTGDSVQAVAMGSHFNNAASGRNETNLAFDGTTAEPSGEQSILTGASQTTSFSAQSLKIGLSEGYHYVTLLTSVDSGTGTWVSDADGRRTCILSSITR